jgi:hypothetical protein
LSPAIEGASHGFVSILLEEVCLLTQDQGVGKKRLLLRVYLDGLDGVFDLEETTFRREGVDASIVF